MSNLRHHSLVAWQRADDLFVKLHRIANKQLPATERFELGSQLRRAAYSVPANIVEGFARRYRRGRLHFLNIAEASLAEVGYCLHVAHRLGYIDEKLLLELESDVRAAGAPLAGLVRSTKVQLAGTALAMALAVAVLFFTA
jgi:four helix bundle protein